MEWFLYSLDEDSLIDLGCKLADYVKAGVVFSLNGKLGAGKTTLARAIIRQSCNIHIHTDIPSPTFNLVQSYETNSGFELWHFDLYRLSRLQEVLELGIEEALIEHCCIIEWPGLIEQIIPSHSVHIELDFQDTNSSNLSNQRIINIKTSNPIMATFNGLCK